MQLPRSLRWFLRKVMKKVRPIKGGRAKTWTEPWAGKAVQKSFLARQLWMRVRASAMVEQRRALAHLALVRHQRLTPHTHVDPLLSIKGRIPLPPFNARQLRSRRSIHAATREHEARVRLSRSVSPCCARYTLHTRLREWRLCDSSHRISSNSVVRLSTSSVSRETVWRRSDPATCLFQRNVKARLFSVSGTFREIGLHSRSNGERDGKTG